jgi:hypothetical protein
VVESLLVVSVSLIHFIRVVAGSILGKNHVSILCIKGKNKLYEERSRNSN